MYLIFYSAISYIFDLSYNDVVQGYDILNTFKR
jgi:hypothetical protein